MNILPYVLSSLVLTCSFAVAQASELHSEIISATSILPDLTHSDTTNQTIVIQTGESAIAELIINLSAAVHPPKIVRVTDSAGHPILSQIRTDASSILMQFTPPIPAKSQVTIELQQVHQMLWTHSVFYNLAERSVGQDQPFLIGMIELVTYRSPANE